MNNENGFHFEMLIVTYVQPAFAIHATDLKNQVSFCICFLVGFPLAIESVDSDDPPDLVSIHTQVLFLS